VNAPGALTEARALIQRELSGGELLEDQHPLVFARGAPGRLIALEEEGRVVSACATLVRDLAVRGERVRVGLIGSVVTDPAQRRRGLGAKLLARAQSALAQQGCLIGLLWADEPEFYRRRGWREAGCEVDFVIDPAERARLPEAAGATLRSAAPDDHGTLHRLYAMHGSRVDRTPGETRALLSARGVETLVLERGRDIVAYACLGRGRDLARCVHEWGGAADDVLALVREHGERLARRGEDGALFLMTPPGAQAVHACLTACGIAGASGLLGMARVLDPAGAVELVRRAARGRVRAGIACDPSRELESTAAHFAGPGGELALSPDALLDLLLPARGERAAIEALERAAGLALPGLPLALYVWGLDSI
jgi:GNAT superfamily N-acetyltransferase